MYLLLLPFEVSVPNWFVWLEIFRACGSMEATMSA